MIDLIWTKIGELQAAVVDLSKIDPIGWKVNAPQGGYTPDLLTDVSEVWESLKDSPFAHTAEPASNPPAIAADGAGKEGA